MIKNAFKNLPDVSSYTGNMGGERGENSKCPYDFVLNGDKKLSLKTNSGKMICPPDVGQPAAKTCYLFFKDLIEENYMNGPIFKKMVLKSVDKLIPIYLDHLFDSDFLLWIYKGKTKYDFRIFDKGYGNNLKWKKESFTFTKNTIGEWNVSNSFGEYNSCTPKILFKISDIKLSLYEK